MSTESTTVTQVEVDLDKEFGQPGAESVMVPEKKDEKPSFFSSGPKADMKFLDTTGKEEEGKEDNEEEGATSTTGTGKEEDAEVTAAGVVAQTKDDDDEEGAGKIKFDKPTLEGFFSKLIEKKALMPFDDEKALKDYTIKDYYELVDANFQEKEKTLREEVSADLFDSLPEELQYAAKYVADGGRDMKGLFRALAEVQEVQELDPTNEPDQEKIARQYLKSTNFGSEEEIDEEISSWKDLKKLAQKAQQFKPKLDKMKEDVVGRKLAIEEGKRKQRAEAAQKYTDNVYSVLEPGDLNGIKLDKKTQGMLYAGLVQPNYPSASGRPTNMLGHLLEKYQWVEPNHGLIAEALWLLADPDGYKAKIKEAGTKLATEKTVRQLKSEEGRRNSGGNGQEEGENNKRTGKIARPGNFFKR